MEAMLEQPTPANVLKDRAADFDIETIAAQYLKHLLPER
jgi:hypothetical protein